MRESLPEHIDRQHCILKQQYAVYTPPMDEMISQIGDWIDQQLPGGYIYGASRLGKSRCIQWYLEIVLQERFKSILPIIVWNRPADSQTSEAAFWNQILKASKFEFTKSFYHKRVRDAFELCKQRFISVAENSKSNYAILLIDEAQDLTLKEWKWLVGMQNTLDYAGYVLSIFSVGSHQLGYQHDYIAKTGSAHIAARFMVANARFHGLQSVEEIEYVLNEYDVDSEWPLGSQISYLQYFSPNDFADGRRLSGSSKLLWNALLELTPDSAKKYKEFPMQHIARVVESVLRQLASGRDWDDATSYENWLKELTKTNFPDHMRIIASGG
ncbi:ATP-binding protein [Burkholderia stabilis]|uniref:ATP-binding protein n=1 Tax=Burkholderia stabilis TaxID=95485 RepID=UPI001F4AE626|nr:ATP-binding protein [Burkholderia stabilis]